MKKRFLACLLALCLLVCGGLPMGASAIEIADSTILAQHFQLDGSGEFTKETFSSTTSHHLTPGSFAQPQGDAPMAVRLAAGNLPGGGHVQPVVL